MKRNRLPANGPGIKKAKSAGKWARGKTENGSIQVGINGDEVAETTKSRKAGEKIFQYATQEEWPKARKLIKKELTRKPDDHWLWMMLGHTWYEQYQYKKGLAFARKAVALQPECPMALFYLGSNLEMLRRFKDAVAVFQKILDRETEDVAYEECGEGLRGAMKLQNDCHYRMARCFLELKEKKAAQVSLGKYLHNRSHGLKSTYSLKKAKEMLAEATNHD